MSYVDELYMQGIPEDQYGAATGRGTDFAAHIVRSYIDMCDMVNCSYMILFLDLVNDTV